MVGLILGVLAVVAVVAVLVFATSRLESGQHLGEPI